MKIEFLYKKFLLLRRDVYTLKEEDFIRIASKYPNRRGFFEMVRFDFVIDSKMNVFLMEVNMSPNLSSKHFAANRLLYEQVGYLYTSLQFSILLYFIFRFR